MKMLPIATCVALTGWIVSTTCSASSAGTCTVEQPLNLGPDSDPARIPLARTPVLCNYNYGIHPLIGYARPFPDGAMHWEGGSELDQNLASVYGISVEPEDSSQVPGKPVTVRLKPWKVPAYSPYTREQVLAATVWSLIRSTGGTPETPLELLVLAEGADDKALEAKYSGEYVTQRGKDGKEVPPAKVPGTLLEVDARGIAWVSFPEIPRKNVPPSPSPVMLITESRGDGTPGWHLVPVWGNGHHEQKSHLFSASSISMSQVIFPFRGTADANSFVSAGGMDSIKYGYRLTDDNRSVEFSYPRMKPEILAAQMYALVLTALPTEEEPLKVIIRHRETDPAVFSAFRNSPEWKEIPAGAPDEDTLLECELVWNPENRLLKRGSIPLVEMGNMSWIEKKEDSETVTTPPVTKLPEASSPTGNEAGEKDATTTDESPAPEKEIKKESE